MMLKWCVTNGVGYGSKHFDEEDHPQLGDANSNFIRVRPHRVVVVVVVVVVVLSKLNYNSHKFKRNQPMI